jgi:hypothetical protein
MSNVFLMANDAATTLAAPISNTATSVNLAVGTGSEFPNPSAGQQFPITFNDAATGLLVEIVYCTARSGDTCTIVRAQESTVAQNWLAGDLAANLITAGVLAAFSQSAALNPARTITTSGAFTMTTSDAGGGVLLNRVTSPGVSSVTLPVSSGGETYAIEDGAKNFNAYPVTVTYPGGTTGPDGATTETLNVNGQSARFRFYADSNIWSFKP